MVRDLARTWRYTPKTINSVYIRAAPLIVKNCDLDSSTHAIFFLTDNDSAMSIVTVSHDECQWSVRSTFCSCLCVNAFIHWNGRRQNTRCSSSTDTRHVKQVLKTFKSALMLLLVQKEQLKPFFNHTSLFLCYRHLNNKSTRDAPNVRQPKIAKKKIYIYFSVWPNKREDRINCTKQCTHLRLDMFCIWGGPCSMFLSPKGSLPWKTLKTLDLNYLHKIRKHE